MRWRRYNFGVTVALVVAAATILPTSRLPVEANAVVANVSAGGLHTCALTSSGGVKCWGFNGFGELGDGTNADSNLAIDVSGLSSGVAEVSSGAAHTCAVTTAGGGKCWGSNVAGELGDGTNSSSNVPVDVSGLASGVASITTGEFHACALTVAGGVECWGDNFYGQLGDGTNASSNVPVSVTGLGSGVAAISASIFNSCALTTTGGVKCWGLNADGQLGDGTNAVSNVPVDVSGLTSGVTALSVGYYHSCAVTATGGAKCWGKNLEGQLGDGTNASSNVPVDVSGLPADVATVAAAHRHSCALTTDGGVKCWGANDYGQLGNASNAASNVPVSVSGLSSGVSVLSSDFEHTCVMRTDNAIRCWGYNGFGELGNGSQLGANVPVHVSLKGPGDTDEDGCTDVQEQESGTDSELDGGQRDYLNPNDYFNPSHDLKNRVDDILLVVQAYFDDDSDGSPGLPPYAPGYSPDTDRTLVGPNAWNLGPPNGLQRVDDILNQVKQYFHDCG